MIEPGAFPAPSPAHSEAGFDVEGNDSNFGIPEPAEQEPPVGALDILTGPKSQSLGASETTLGPMAPRSDDARGEKGRRHNDDPQRASSQHFRIEVQICLGQPGDNDSEPNASASAGVYVLPHDFSGYVGNSDFMSQGIKVGGRSELTLRHGSDG